LSSLDGRAIDGAVRGLYSDTTYPKTFS